MTIDRDEQLRQRAYRIWESEGRPDGQEAQHWARAESELANEEAGFASVAPTVTRTRRKASPAAAGTDAAAAGAKKKPASAKPKAPPRKT